MFIQKTIPCCSEIKRKRWDSATAFEYTITLAETVGMAEEKHVLCFKSGDDYLGFVGLNFKNDRYGEIIVSELSDY